MRIAVALIFVLAAPLATAQQDPMEEQRCVWRCLADSQGATDPAYGACVAAQCGAGPDPAPSDPTASWFYGDHAVLGRGAFGQAPSGVIGLACGASGAPVDLRLTNGLYSGKTVTLMFAGAPDALPISRARGAATQMSGDTCETGVDAFRKASRLYVIDGSIASVATDDAGRLSVTLEGLAGTVTVRSGADALRELGGTEVSLTGSSAAIDRMLADCPAARADIAANCGL